MQRHLHRRDDFVAALLQLRRSNFKLFQCIVFATPEQFDFGDLPVLEHHVLSLTGRLDALLDEDIGQPHEANSGD